MRKPDESAPVSYAYPTLPAVNSSTKPPVGQSVPPIVSSAAAHSSDRLIKPLPTSLAKASATSNQQKYFDPKPTPHHIDEIVPRPQPRPKAPINSISRPLGLASGSGSISEDTEISEESSGDEGLDFALKTSHKRSAKEMLDDFKCASLTSAASLTKPTRIAAPVTHTSAHERPSITSSLPRPSSHTTQGPGLQRSNPSLGEAPSSTDAISRKRKLAPTKYQYFDLDSDEDDAVVEGDSEYVPPEQLKLPASKKLSGATKAAPASSRRHSSST